MKGTLTREKSVSKKLFSRELFSVLSLIGAFFTAITPKIAYAGIGESIGSAILNYLLSLALGFWAAILTFLTLIVNAVLTAVAFLLKYIVDWSIDLALNIPYTSGTVFVSAWPVLRDLANMGLILILVAIGIGTMLNLGRRRGFLDKSRLPMFLLVALLINFTPVFTGIIIDFTNIIANVFWQAAQQVSNAFIGANVGASIGQDLGELGDIVDAAIGGNFDAEIFFSVLITAAMSIILNLVVIFAFLMLIALFLGRVLALLLLVILSPVAFLGLIWSRGEKIRRSLWDKWWHNFLQWSIIVIPLIFFMWLSGVFTLAANDMCEFQLTVGGDIADTTGDASSHEFVCGAVNMMLAAGALIFGVIVSFNSSAAGAKIITKRAQQAWKTGRRATGYAALKYGPRAVKGTAKGVGKGIGLGGRKIAGTGVGQATGRKWSGFKDTVKGSPVGQGAQYVGQVTKKTGAALKEATYNKLPDSMKLGMMYTGDFIKDQTYGRAKAKYAGLQDKLEKDWQKIKGPGECYNKMDSDRLIDLLQHLPTNHAAKVLDKLVRSPATWKKLQDAVAEGTIRAERIKKKIGKVRRKGEHNLSIRVVMDKYDKGPSKKDREHIETIERLVNAGHSREDAEKMAAGEKPEAGPETEGKRGSGRGEADSEPSYDGESSSENSSENEGNENSES